MFQNDLVRTTQHDPDADDVEVEEIAPGRVTLTSELAGGEPRPSGILNRRADGEAAVDEHGVHANASEALGRAAGTSGAPLPGAIKTRFESSLGADLSGVRVHTDGASAVAAKSVAAKAYTVGNDIFFGAGYYNPENGSGQELLAHEVAHTVQQSGAPTVQYKLEVSQPGDSAEVEADQAAAAMVSGRPAAVTFGSGIARKVMREGEGGAKTGAPGQAGSSAKGTWHLGEVKLGEKKVGFFDLGVSYACDVNYEAGTESTAAGPKAAPDAGAPSEPSNSYDQTHNKGPASTTGGTTGAPGDAGVQAEVKKELDGGFTNFKPSLKGGVEITGKQIKVETAIEYETKWGGITFTTSPFTFTILKWEAGKTPEVAVAGVTLAAAIPFKEWTSGSTKYKLECQGKFALEIKPDLIEIGKYIAEHAAEILTAEFAITAGLIAGGVLAIGAALYQIAKSDEFTQRTEPEVKKCRAYCHGYDAAMKGGAGGGEGEGAAEGFAAGTARLKAIESGAMVPAGAAAEKAKGYDFYMQAWNKAWPQVKARCIASYWEEHYVEKALTGGEGQGNGGFKTFKMLLDGWDRG